MYLQIAFYFVVHTSRYTNYTNIDSLFKKVKKGIVSLLKYFLAES